MRLDVADAEETFDFIKMSDGEIERTLKIPILTQSKLQKILKIKGVSGYFEESNILLSIRGWMFTREAHVIIRRTEGKGFRYPDRRGKRNHKGIGGITDICLRLLSCAGGPVAAVLFKRSS